MQKIKIKNQWQNKKRADKAAKSTRFFLYLILGLFIAISFYSCKKQLEEKPAKNLQVPSTLKDLQAILDNSDDMNNWDPEALEISSDDYYLFDNTWDGLYYDTWKNLYIWEKDVFNDGLSRSSWTVTYIPVYKSNIVLEALEKIQRVKSNLQEWNNIKGSALFFRSKAFYQAAQIWAKAYGSSTSSTDLGIPLRLTSDINTKSVRASTKQTYEKIINDLIESIKYLPEKPSHVMRPSRGAAYGMLAKTFLAMQNYIKAGVYADSCLQLNNVLLDFNTLNPALTNPVPRFNSEVTFSSTINFGTNITSGRVDTFLYRSYADNDLRKVVFFRNFAAGGIGFKGSFDGSYSPFTGISVNEMLLIRAECYARSRQAAKALNDLNTLLEKRWKTGTYEPYTFTDDDELLRLILQERRKELLFRGSRWTDLKRLNKEPRFAITIKRLLKGKLYELPPNDNRYAAPLPNSVIEINGIQQNLR